MDYQYSSIEAITNNASPRNCNVYGIVIDLKEASRSQGSDYFGLIVLIDSTTKTPLKVRLFHKDKTYFPKVAYGDIMRLHRLRVFRQYNDTSLVSRKRWSWVIWKYQNIDNPLLKGESSSMSYTLLQSDIEKVKSLQLWQKQFSDVARDWVAQRNKTILEIRQGDHFDLLCQIVDFTDYGGYWYVRVWDGTKPQIVFHQHPIKNRNRNNESLPKECLVDVIISNDHYEKCKSLGIAKGSFVILMGLYAFPNPELDANASGKRCSELRLYEGNWSGHGIKNCDLLDESCQKLKSNLDLARKRASHDMHALSNLKSFLKRIAHGVGDDSPSAPKKQRLQETKISKPSKPFKEVGPDSATVISGDSPTCQLSTIKSLVDEKDPGLFLVKCRLKTVCTPREAWVSYYHTVGNRAICIPSKNDGEPLKITKETEKMIAVWRKVTRKRNTPNVGKLDSVDTQSSTPWKIPLNDGNTITISISEERVARRDGSHWKEIRMDDFLVRRRITEGREFSILYILKPTDFSKEGLLKHQSSYNRVVRILPLDVLTSNAPPAVAIQDGVFYYCCPANAIPLSIPPLQEEAERCSGSEVVRIAGSPLLKPRFDIGITIEDDTDRIDKVSIVASNVTRFLRGLTPQVYLADIDTWCRRLESTFQYFIDRNKALCCVIEKTPQRNNFSYQIQHTILKEQFFDFV